jgi:hypothetical protein
VKVLQAEQACRLGEKMTRVLVTGHLDYIGTVPTPMLLKAGHSVVCYDGDLYERRASAPGGEIDLNPQATFDINHKASVERARKAKPAGGCIRQVFVFENFWEARRTKDVRRDGCLGGQAIGKCEIFERRAPATIGSQK